MARSKKSKSTHNTTVKRLAKQYKQKGYRVKADIEGWEKPDTIRGVRPDIIAEKGGIRPPLRSKPRIQLTANATFSNKRPLRTGAKTLTQNITNVS